MSILAINWEPELRGILTVIIAVGVLCGSIYLILGTNMGARLGFLVAFTGLAGWMFIMGAIWWSYGLGLKGPEPTWTSMPGRTVLQDYPALSESGALDSPVSVDADGTFTQQADQIDDQFVSEGWEKLAESAASYGQAGSAAAVFLEETDAFAAGEFKVVNVFDIGGERYPRLMDGKLTLPSYDTSANKISMTCNVASKPVGTAKSFGVGGTMYGTYQGNGWTTTHVGKHVKSYWGRYGNTYNGKPVAPAATVAPSSC